MMIEKENFVTLWSEDGVNAFAPNPSESVEIELQNDTYHTGQDTVIPSSTNTISNNNDEHINSVDDVMGIRTSEPELMFPEHNTRIALHERMPIAENLSISTTWYFPLEIRMLADENREEVFDMDDYDFVDSGEAVWYKDAILGQIEKDNSYFDTPRMLAEYIHDDKLNSKVDSMIPTVEEHCGRLWGAMVMQLSDTLTPDDIVELKDYISGQNSDGYGEGLEQHEIRVSGGELYVSFWNTGKDYAIYTQEEFAALNTQGQTVISERRKTQCPIIGADGNVFNIMGIAARTLKENGMADVAKEMRSRVMDSGSYDNALAIITEYVEPAYVCQPSQDGMVLRM